MKNCFECFLKWIILPYGFIKKVKENIMYRCEGHNILQEHEKVK